jgi:hypothetical protein
MDDITFFVKYSLISSLLIVLGVAIKLYLKKAGLVNLNRVLGVGVFWLKFVANALIVIGSFCVIVLVITFYYFLKYEGYI